MIAFIQLIFIVTEGVRKYVFDHLLILALLDLAVLWTLLRYSTKEDRKFFYIVSGLLLCHTLTFALVYGYSPLTYLAGIRPIIYVFGGIVLAHFHFKRSSDVELLGLGSCVFLVSLFAIVQISLGIDHPINSPPMHLELSRGLGGYSYDVEKLVGSFVGDGGIFRPATVFITTGKFGTYVASVTLMVICLLLTTTHNHSRMFIFVLLGVLVLANLVAMQRAFWYSFALFSILFLLIFKLRREIWKTILLGMIPFFGVCTAFFFEISIIVGRLSQFPGEIIDRVWEFSRILPMSLENIVVGRGFGFFSNYSHLVGGANYMDYYWNTGEGQYHILIAELGMLTCIIMITIAIIFAIRQLIRSLFARAEPEGKYYFVRAYIIALILLWGTTHTIFASVFLVLGLSFSLSILRLKILNIKG